MKPITILSLAIALFLQGRASAAELAVSAKEPIVVVAPAQWTAAAWTVAVDRSPTGLPPTETYLVQAPTNRNAACLVSILGKDRSEFADQEYLQRLLRSDCLPYTGSSGNPITPDINPLKLTGGLGYYANFTDPDMVDKPVKPGEYKTATPIILSLGTNYLVKVTVFCDDLNGADYQDEIKIIESIKIKN